MPSDAIRAAAVATDFVGRASAHVTLALRAARATPRLLRVGTEALRILATQRLRAAQAEVLGPEPDAVRDERTRAAARRVRELCVDMRGGILKLGQLASSRVDLLPRAAIEELALLQDRVPSLPDDVIRARVEAELGRPLDQVFASFGPALAAASLAQVHEATLLDGTEVAVKVLVPGIEALVEADLHAARVLAGACADALPGCDLQTVAAELGRSVRAELDCRAEAAELEGFAARFAADPRIVVPRPRRELTTARVLTMDRLRGARLADAIDERVLHTLVDCFVTQLLEHGVVHADPHPGNFLVLPDGRLALLDFGCVLHLPDAVRQAYAGLVVAVFSRDGARAAALLATLGFGGEPAALLELAELILAPLRDPDLDPAAQLERGLAVLQAHPGIRVPQHFVLVGRVLATLGGLIARHRFPVFSVLGPKLAGLMQA